jgi:hypothetical protein
MVANFSSRPKRCSAAQAIVTTLKWTSSYRECEYPGCLSGRVYDGERGAWVGCRSVLLAGGIHPHGRIP